MNTHVAVSYTHLIMAVEEKKLRRLTIKAYHMDTVVMGDRNDITTGGKMTVCKDIIPDLLKDAKYINCLLYTSRCV